MEFEASSSPVIQNITVEKSVIVKSNSRRSSAVYIALNSSGNNSVKIHDSTFKDNTYTPEGVGAVIIHNAPDPLSSKGCKNPFNSTTDAYEVFRYTNRIFFRNSVFEHNVGQYAGAVLILNGLTEFTNCTFVDNFAEFRAGHFTIEGGSGGAKLYNCIFRQRKETSPLVSGKGENNVYFFYSAIPGTLFIRDTVMDFTPAKWRVPSLVEIVNGGHVVLDNSSSIL